MKLIEQFDNIEPIEPSAEWHNKLMQRIEQSTVTVDDKNATQWMIVSTVILLLINVYVFTNESIPKHQMQQNTYKNIAEELLISSNSSKY